MDGSAEIVGSFESLLSRVTMKYTVLGLNDKNLGEHDYRNYVLEEYTFLKRPVFIPDNQIYIRNSKKNIAPVAKVLKS